jgi:predicted kinase
MASRSTSADRVPRPSVVVVTGPPGAGKSTVARLVAARFDPAVCIESDWFWKTVVRGFVPPWEPEADPQNRVVVRAFASAAAVMAAGGYGVVVDGIVGPWNLDVVTEQLEALDVDCAYFVLRPAREVALARATARVGEAGTDGHPPLTDEGPILHMWDQFSDLGQYEDRVIDNTDLSADATADLIWREIHAQDRGASGP